ncbi:MAG: hypothetical protein IPO00_03605 [Betaproteobacteria bacterium]|nr:hypothetical protein [Betaproteobacteria bacterium]
MASGAVAIRACENVSGLSKAVMRGRRGNAGQDGLDAAEGRAVAWCPAMAQASANRTGPLVTPMPDPKKMQEPDTAPLLQNPEQLRSCGECAGGYPSG